MPEENNWRPRAHFLQMGQKLLGHMGAVQVDAMNVAGVALQPAIQVTRHVLTHQHLDTQILQNPGIGLVRKEVGAEKDHLEAHVQHQLHVHERGTGAGILVIVGHVVINHQNAVALPGAVTGQENVLGIGKMKALEGIPPLVDELQAIDLLVFLDAAALVGAVADPFKVKHHRMRLQADPKAPLAGGKTQVGILVVGRGITGVEAIQLTPERTAHQQAGAGDIVDLLDILVLGLLRVVTAAVVPAGTVPPDDSARLLQLAVREQQPRSGDTDIGPVIQQRHQRREPVFTHRRIVVEQQKVVATRLHGCGVAVVQKTPILLLADNPHIAHPFEDAGGQIGGGIVGNDHLVVPVPGLLKQRRQAMHGHSVIVEHRQDNRHPRLLAGRKLQLQLVQCRLQRRGDHPPPRTGILGKAAANPDVEIRRG